MPVDHYENFPVASILMPRRLVPAVEAIYAFARSADDLADEGDAGPSERLAALRAYEDALDGTLSAADQATFDLHLVGCTTCAAQQSPNAAGRVPELQLAFRVDGAE